MLLGQNVNSYGQDFDYAFDFADLLKTLDETGKISRIRYMTSHPRDFSKKLIDTIYECESVCEHFHLPIQSGSNRILKFMNRGYTREFYLSLIEEVKKILYHSLTTDIIIGFPKRTGFGYGLFKVEFDAAYTFLY